MIDSIDSQLQIPPIITITGHRINALRLRLEQMRQEDYPSNTPIQLIDILLKILNCLFESLGELLKEFNNSKTDTERQDTLNEVLSISQVVITIVKYIEIINSAKTEWNSWGLVHYVERLVERIDLQTKVIIHPQWTYNYSYKELVNPLRGLVAAINPEAEKNIFRGYPRNLIILTFPIIERDSLLRNAIISHEIGHFIDYISGLTKTVLQQPLVDATRLNSLTDKLTTKEGLSKDSADYQKAKAEIANKVIPLLKRWITEVIADILAVNLLGVAAIFAFEEVVLSTQPGDAFLDLTNSMEFSQYERISIYPPIKLRVRIMLDVMDSLNIANEVQKSEDQKLVTAFMLRVASLRSFCQDYNPDNYNGHIGVVAHSFEIALEYIYEELKTVKVQDLYNSLDYVALALSLTNLLVHKLPPSELMDTTKSSQRPGMRAIINAGWLYYVAYQNDLSYYNGEPWKNIYQEYLRTNRLLNKAVEISEVVSELTRRGNATI